MSEHMSVTLDEHPEPSSIRWNRILPAATLLTLIGAWIWGGLLILTGTMAWIVAIGIGVGIGTVLSRISGPMNDTTCILAAGSTLVAISIGQIWFLVD
ncbi:MAG: hypothetical protein QF645_11990, partial [Planctomycetota bacterium]|nr:hypothetical protein [Planctomycetota bacterium]